MHILLVEMLPITNRYRTYAKQILIEISEKLEEMAVIDVFDGRVVIYYRWVWYKKRLKRDDIMGGTPFIVRKNDLFDKKGELNEIKLTSITRKLLNYFIWHNENGNPVKLYLN